MTRPAHRFHYPGKLETAAGQLVALPEKESHHLLHVLRLKTGDSVVVFDSDGSACNAEVAEPQGKIVLVKLIEACGNPQADADEEKPRLHLAACLLKHRAMDWMIEKLSELDVASLQPLISRRTIVQAKGADGEATGQMERWERITLAAAKQAGRNVPLQLLPVLHIDEWLKHDRPRTLACFANKSEKSTGLGQWLGARAGMGLAIQAAVGPEGGWTSEEVEAFVRAGFMEVSLGPLVLRAETAAITVAAACRVMM